MNAKNKDQKDEDTRMIISISNRFINPSPSYFTSFQYFTDIIEIEKSKRKKEQTKVR